MIEGSENFGMRHEEFWFGIQRPNFLANETLGRESFNNTERRQVGKVMYGEKAWRHKSTKKILAWGIQELE